MTNACTVALFLSDLNYGLVWKVEGYDDRYAGENIEVFSRIGVYGNLKGNKIHNNYMGACEGSCLSGRGSHHDSRQEVEYYV